MEHINKIKEYIVKNKISKKYVDMLENVKTKEELEALLKEVKNKKLYTFIEKLLLENKEKVHYLSYDNAIFLNMINEKHLDILEKDILKLLDNKEYTKLFEIVKEKRKEVENTINIHSYCMDYLKLIVGYIDKTFSLIQKESGTRKEFIQVIEILNLDRIIRKEVFDYFAMSIRLFNFNDNDKNYIYNECKRLNIKKNVFNAKDINTNIDFINKIREIIFNLISGNENSNLDFYSYKNTILLLNKLN